MQYDLQALGFPMTEALREHMLRRLRYALSRVNDTVQRITVRVGDTNGPRGGRDKYCRIQVNLTQSDPVLIEEVGTDLYNTIDRAADRAGRTVARRIERRHDDVRSSAPGRPRRLPWRTGRSSQPRQRDDEQPS